MNEMTVGDKPTFADLFCGCGGLALGFRQAGFESVFALDIDTASCRTYKANFGHEVFCGDIADLKALPAKPDVVIGGPPCQGFSSLGKMTPSEACRNNHVTLNALWLHFFRLIEDSEAKAFVIENVPQILKSKEYHRIIQRAESLGFDAVSGVLRAEDYGVPQRRKRAFILGGRGFLPALPAPKGPMKTVRDAIGDLPPKPDGTNWHVGRTPTRKSLERYACIPSGGNRFDLMRKRPDLCPRCWLKKEKGSTDVFGRLKWDRPALTIRTEFYKPEKGCYLHPSEDRPITHREAARIQTFPDDFMFLGTKIEVARMIGNSVPPRLAFCIGDVLKKAMTRPSLG